MTRNLAAGLVLVSGVAFASEAGVRRGPPRESPAYLVGCAEGARLVAMGDVSKGMSKLRELIAVEPNLPRAHLLLIEAHLRADKLEGVDARLEDAERSASRNRVMQQRLLFLSALVHERRQEGERALADWGKLLVASEAPEESLFAATAKARIAALTEVQKQKNLSDAVRERSAKTSDGGVFTETRDAAK